MEMAPGLCEKSLLDVEEGLPPENPFREHRAQILKIIPSLKDSGTVQEEAYLLERNGKIEIKLQKTEPPEQTKYQRNIHENENPSDYVEFGVNERDRKCLDNEEWGKEEDGGGREGGEGGGGGGGKKAEDTSIENNSLERRKTYFQRYRDLAAYWFLGFCNNFTYWVMITAAYDLLTPEFQGYYERSEVGAPASLIQDIDDTTGQQSPYEEFTLSDVESTTASTESSWQNESLQQHYVNTFECQKHSTGVILIADTLPATALTLASPLTLLMPVSTRVWLVSVLCAASYFTLGLAHPKWVFLGVAFASASRGFSDSTFLGHASHYHKHVLSMWSSGTGVATFIGPLMYSSLTTGGLDPRHALLIFLAIPIVTALSFWCLLSRYEDDDERRDAANPEEVSVLKSSQDISCERQKMCVVIRKKLYLFLRAQKYILPLSAFYLVMYTTNQGLLELVYFPASMFTHAQQYSWSNTVRCFGTLISRSAHKFLLLSNSWIYSCLALLIMCIVGTEAYYHYLPSEYIIFVLLLLQGLLEGAAFRSSIFNIHNKTSEEDRAFCLGVFPTSLFLPALVAGLISMPLHAVLCSNHMYKT